MTACGLLRFNVAAAALVALSVASPAAADEPPAQKADTPIRRERAPRWDEPTTPPGGPMPEGYAPYPYKLPPPPPVLTYREGIPIPEGYHLQERPSRGVILSGAVLLGNAYLLSVIGALSAMSDYNGDARFSVLFIPVVGPFISIGTVPDAALSNNHGTAVGPLMVVDGISQVAGVALIVGGALAKRPVVVRNDLATASAAPEVFVGPSSASLRWRF